MKRVELWNMEYGECVCLLGKDQSLLMVDCGSVSQKLRQGDVPLDQWVDAIGRRYEAAMERWFLLSHYHRDHLSGFRRLLAERPGYFSRALLPRLPQDSRGGLPLVEFALFAHLFAPPQSDAFQVNTWCLGAFRALEKQLGADRIFTLGAGDVFRFDGVEYEVLWPRQEDYPFEPALLEALEALNVLFASPFLPECVRRFRERKGEFLNLYGKCEEAFSISGRALPEKRRAYLSHLGEALEELEGLREQLSLCPQSHDAWDLLRNPLWAGAYTSAANGASVVFHNRRQGGPSEQDVLFTGDSPPETLAEIAPLLYDGYYILKAPHHGTASGWSPLFSDMSFAHILISNGEYHAGGAVAQAYIDRQDSIRHCAGTGACKWFGAAQACCNRLSACYEQKRPGLVIRCREAGPLDSWGPGCGVRVITPGAERGCLCDVGTP